MLSREATNTNFIVFALTRPGLELTIYHTLDEHANNNITNADQTVRNRGNQSTYYRKLSEQSIQRRKCLKILMRNKTFIYFPNLQNIAIWNPFRNKIPTFFHPLITN